MDNIKHRSTIGLFCIIAIAFAVRWYNLPQRGIISRDEAWYTYSARGLESRIHELTQKQPVAPARDWQLPDFERISSNNVAGKPTYVVILWLLGAARGSWDYDNVLGLSLFTGIINIAALYWLSRQARLNIDTALLASLSGAVSFTSIYFSRIGYPHALLILTHTLALGFYLNADKEKPLSWSLFAAGLLWGVGLSVHTSLALALPGVVVGEIYFYRKNLTRNTRALLQRSFRWGGGILCALLGWEIAYHIAPYILGSGLGLISLTGSFLGDLIKHAESGGVNFNPIANAIFYGFALFGMENPLSSLFFLVGFISVWKMEGIGENGRVLSLFSATNLLSLIAYPALYGRQLAPLMSIWPLFTAIGISVLIEFGKRYVFFGKRTMAAIVIVFISIFNLYWACPLLAADSTGWVKSAHWIQTNAAPDDWVFTSDISDAAILNYYLPGRVLLWSSSETGQLPSKVRWYIQNPTGRFVRPPISDEAPTTTLADPWLLLRPHSVISGNWLLIPWWRWSAAPKSYHLGVDDVVQIYQIP